MSDPRISLVKGFLSVTYLPITHIIYNLITYRNCKESVERSFGSYRKYWKKPLCKVVISNYIVLAFVKLKFFS